MVLGIYFEESSVLVSLSLEAMSPDIASAVACLSCSLSGTVVCSLVLVSFSSSLSPRLNGSFSATGEGSTVAKGCHLLDLLPLDTLRPVSISVGGPSWKETFRLSGEGEDVFLKFVLARGRGGRGGGAGTVLLVETESCPKLNQAQTFTIP